MEPAIRVESLVKRYGQVKAVDGLDLTIPAGEIFGFLGPNGAGKTTTVRILTTLTKPDAGRAVVFGFDVVQEAVAAKGLIGLCPQQTNVDAELSVYENLKLHGLLHGMPSGLRESRIRELLEFTGLSERRKDQAKVLSGGLKRRLMIARALLHEPRILFLDEPTVGLDPQTRRRLWDLIRAGHRAGATIFLTTHYIEEAERLCHRVGIIDQGRLIALDSPAALLERVGRVVVEDGGRGGCPDFFDNRGKAAAHAAGLEGDVIIRAANLEDVFIRLTGRRVRP